MSTDLAVPAGAERPVRPRESGGSLTRRASLTAVASLLDYFVRAAVSLVVTPILVRGLGAPLFGAWEMLSRLTGYMSAADGRPTEALRLLVARHQGPADAAIRRRFVGAALMVWLIMLPLVLLVGAALVFVVVPRLVRVTPELGGDVQRATALLIGAFVATGLGAIPESVLRGMNLGYKRMGVQAALNVLGGALAALFVWYGLALSGMGLSMIARTAVAALVFYLLARRHVAGFGSARPAAQDVRTVFGMSMWLSLGDVIAKIGLASDVLVLGAIAGPAVVATYALTSYAARTAVGIHVFTAGAAIPGLGGLLGTNQLERAAAARRELLLLTWLFATVVGSLILMWNGPFLATWVGAHHYAGPLVNLLIVAGAAQTAFIRTDAYILDAALQPRARVLVGAFAAVLTIAAGITLTRLYGLPGLCAGMLIGRAVQSIGYPVLARTRLGLAARIRPLVTLRYAAATLLLYAAALLVRARVGEPGWTMWLAGVLASVPVVTAAALLLGPDATARRRLLNRLSSLLATRWRR
jgi:O-antigen/teichoic acid export membrane protein